MAELHVLGSWHGPGEEKTARRLAAALPRGWDVVAGRDVPDGVSTVDLDLVVVSPNAAVFVCEEKAWGREIDVDEVAWYVDGRRRHNPNSQVQHAARVLAGRVRTRVPGWRAAAKQLGPGRHAVRGHVVLSHDHVELRGADTLGPDVVLRLDDAPATLRRLDAGSPAAMGALRTELMDYLLGLNPRRDATPPRSIFQYTILDRPVRQENALLYPARNPAGQFLSLCCVPVDGTADPESARLLATREHDALAALALRDRTWRVQGWFPWEGYIVTPVIVELDGRSLGTLAPAAVDVPTIVHDAFRALSDVHAHGITHRALRPRSIEVSERGRVRFRDFGRARLQSEPTIAGLLDDGHPSSDFRPPGVPLALHGTADDVYGLALALTCWWHGTPDVRPDHDDADRLAGAVPVVGQVLAACLVRDAGRRPSAAQAAARTAPARAV